MYANMAGRDVVGMTSVVIITGFAFGMVAYAVVKELQAKRAALSRAPA